MRVLVFSALIACVSAAPSFLAPVPLAAYRVSPLAYAPILIAPTIPPGDIQAAVIDAQVKIADQARLIADQAKDLAEQAVEKQNDVVFKSNDLEKEKTEEEFWAAEEKKWQALNQAQIAEARLAGSIASNFGVPSAEEEKTDIEVKAEVKSEDTQVKSETIEVKSEEKAEVKTAEPEKPAEAEKPVEAEKKEEAVEVKAAASEDSKTETIGFHGFKSPLLGSPITVAQAFPYSYVAPLSYQTAYKSYPFPAIQPVAGFPQFYQPTIAVKHAW